MNCPYFVKVCTKCKRILIANNLNFHKGKKGKYGYVERCKKCRKEEAQDNREKNIEKSKKWYINNKDKKSKYDKEYKKKNKEKIQQRDKEYYKENKKRIQQQHKEYREENPHIQFNADNKRRKLEENQGRGISKDQWYEMFNFFEWKCAYSDIQLNENNRSIDHIIALNNNGLNEPWNCVPMYRPYNTSKYISNMEEWYKKQEFYSEERLQKIYAWCEYAFKKWKPRRKGNKKSSGK